MSGAGLSRSAILPAVAAGIQLKNCSSDGNYIVHYGTAIILEPADGGNVSASGGSSSQSSPVDAAADASPDASKK